METVAALSKAASLELTERFPKKELLEAFSILQASYYKEDGSIRPDFDKSLDYLAKFYGEEKRVMLNRGGRGTTVAPLISARLFRNQATKYRMIITGIVAQLTVWADHNPEKVEKVGLTKNMWRHVMQSGVKEDVSEFVKLATILLILPASSAQAERLFSCMNFLKNDARNALGGGTI